MRCCAFALLLCAAFPAAAQMFKCVDERGVTHYTDKPLPGCKGGEVDIQGSPPMSGKLTPRKDDVDRQNIDFYRRQRERDRELASQQAARTQQCARLRQENARLASGQRIARTTPSGERVYIEDADREARLAQLKEELRGCP